LLKETKLLPWETVHKVISITETGSLVEGDRYKYNFELHAEVFEAFSQLQYKHKRADLYLAGEISQTRYQRRRAVQGRWLPAKFLWKK
jgi:hypothetical protein